MRSVVAAVTLCLFVSCAASAQTNSEYRLTEVAPGVLLSFSGEQASLVVVRNNDIAVVDPLNRPHAEWLRQELQRRHPDARVSLLVYSSPRFERVVGASALAAPGDTVGHENFMSGLVQATRRIPAPLRPLDQNSDERLSASELMGDPAAASLLASSDTNRDGVLLPAELFAGVDRMRPARAYKDTLTLSFADTSIVLRHTPLPGRPDVTMAVLPDRRVAFTADLTPNQSPFTPSGLGLRELARQLAMATSIDADTLILGNGTQLAMADLRRRRQYVDGLVSAVLSGYRERLTLTEFVARESAHGGPDASLETRRPDDLARVFRGLRTVRFEAYGGLTGRRVGTNPAYCAGFAVCETGRQMAASLFGLRVHYGRRLSTGIEGGLSQQMLWSRQSTAYDDAFAYKGQHLSWLFRFDLLPGSRVSVAPLAGFSHVSDSVDGLAWLRESVGGGRQEFGSFTGASGPMFGADLTLSLTRRLRIMIPVRMMRVGDRFPTPRVVLGSDHWPGRQTIEIGTVLNWEIGRRAFVPNR